MRPLGGYLQVIFNVDRASAIVVARSAAVVAEPAPKIPCANTKIDPEESSKPSQNDRSKTTTIPLPLW